MLTWYTDWEYCPAVDEVEVLFTDVSVFFTLCSDYIDDHFFRGLVFTQSE